MTLPDKVLYQECLVMLDTYIITVEEAPEVWKHLLLASPVTAASNAALIDIVITGDTTLTPGSTLVPSISITCGTISLLSPLSALGTLPYQSIAGVMLATVSSPTNHFTLDVWICPLLVGRSY